MPFNIFFFFLVNIVMTSHAMEKETDNNNSSKSQNITTVFKKRFFFDLWNKKQIKQEITNCSYIMKTMLGDFEDINKCYLPTIKKKDWNRYIEPFKDILTSIHEEKDTEIKNGHLRELKTTILKKNFTYQELGRLLHIATFLEIDSLLNTAIDVAAKALISDSRVLEELRQSKRQTTYNLFNVADDLNHAIAQKVLEKIDSQLALATLNISHTIKSSYFSPVHYIQTANNGLVASFFANDKIEFSQWKEFQIKLLDTVNTDLYSTKKVELSNCLTKIALANQRVVNIWQVDLGAIILSKQNTWAIQTLKFNAHDSKLAITDWQNIKLIDIASGSIVQSMHHRPEKIKKILFGASDDILISADKGNQICIWDLKSNQRIQKISAQNTFAHEKITVNPLGTIIAIPGIDGKIRLWDIRTEEMMHSLEGHTVAVKSLAFHPHENIIASTADDKTIKLWNVKKGTLHSTLYMDFNVNALAWDTEGKWLFSGTDTSGFSLICYKGIQRSDLPQATIAQTIFLGAIARQKICNRQDFSPLYKTFDEETKIFLNPFLIKK